MARPKTGKAVTSGSSIAARQRVRDGRLRTNIGNVATLDAAVAALNSTERRKGKTVIRVRP